MQAFATLHTGWHVYLNILQVTEISYTTALPCRTVITYQLFSDLELPVMSHTSLGANTKYVTCRLEIVGLFLIFFSKLEHLAPLSFISHHHFIQIALCTEHETVCQ